MPAAGSVRLLIVVSFLVVTIRLFLMVRYGFCFCNLLTLMLLRLCLFVNNETHLYPL